MHKRNIILGLLAIFLFGIIASGCASKKGSGCNCKNNLNYYTPKKKRR